MMVGFFAVTLAHQLEKRIDLFSVERQVSEFVNQEQIIS